VRLSLPGKVRVLESRIRPIVEPRIQEEQYGFCPGSGTLDQLYTLSRMLEDSWEFAQPIHMCFVDLEKAFDCAKQHNIKSGLFLSRCALLWLLLYASTPP